MGPLRKNHAPTVPAYPAPAPADYYDEVTDVQLEALDDLVKEEFQDEEFEVVDGPAW